MTFPTIAKPRSYARDAPALLDYETACRTFSWDMARNQLSGLPDGGGLNIAHEAVDRHAAGPDRDRIAIRWLGKQGARRDISYGELAMSSSRFANALASLGISAGDLVCSLLGRVPELFAAALGTLKRRALFSPLFSAFGPDPIRTRLRLGGAKVLVTTPRLYARKVAPIRAELSALRSVILLEEDGVEPPGQDCAHRSTAAGARQAVNADDIRGVVLGALAAIAPEADLGQLDPAEDVRDAVDLDSMDILRFATVLHERLGIDVPESDYAQIATVDGCVKYLERRVSGGGTGSPTGAQPGRR